MRTAASFLLALVVAGPLDAQGSKAKQRTTVIGLSEIQAALAKEKPLNVFEVVGKARPEWFRFTYAGTSAWLRQRDPQQVPRDASVLELVSPVCYSTFPVYLDDQRVAFPTQLEAWDVAEIRLIEPHQMRVIGDSLVRIGNCGALHVISLGAWYSMQNRAEALDALRTVGDVTLEQVDVLFKTFGFAWRPEAPNLVVYEHPTQAVCGNFKRPTDPAWDVMPGAMRDQAILLLTCVKARDANGNAIFVGDQAR